MNQKEVFKNIFIIIAVILTVMPTLVTFSALLTSIFNHMQWYVLLQKYVVPFEARLVAVIIKAVGITALITPDQPSVSLLLKKSSAYIPVVLEWNCLGWQSMLLLIVTLVTGLRGNYTLMSKLETILFGILGTFLSNLFRMAFIVTVAFYWNKFAALIIHDYFAVFIALIWMIFFWWFSYAFVLEEKSVKVKQTVKQEIKE